MTDPRTPEVADPFPTDRRIETIGGSVSLEEKAKIQQALAQAGYRNMSEGIRDVLLAFVESTKVRDAVATPRISVPAA